jgi:DNA-binding protein WhiA
MTTLSFTKQVKEELCALPWGDLCCIQAELAGVLMAMGRFRSGSVTVHTVHDAFAHRLSAMLSKLYDADVGIEKGRELISVTLGGEPTYGCLHADLVSTAGFDATRGLLAPDAATRPLFDNECCRTAGLRGMFLACGSLSEPSKAYHLEIAARRPAGAQAATMLFAVLGMHGGVMRRAGYSVAYIKEGQQVSDFLLLTGAHASLLELENQRVEKEMRNSVNRVVNCDNANLQRLADTAARQQHRIRRLLERGGLGALPEGLRQAAEARLANPDLSIAELGERMDPPLGKSGMNHRLRRLEALLGDGETASEKGEHP